MNRPPSIQDVLRGRHGATFVGRGDIIQFFRDNLKRRPYDHFERRFIINVWGQGGVGKTALLGQFRESAVSAGALTAYIDHAAKDIPHAMGSLARQLEQLHHPLRTFAKRYQLYRQKQRELQADPDFVQDFAPLVGRTIVKLGLGAIDDVPVLGGALGGVLDGEARHAISEQVGQWAKYVASKLKNRDEARLVLDPVGTLTALFVSDLSGVLDERDVCLFIDTYEMTGGFLDAWLRDLFDPEGNYGRLPTNLVITIAGREELHRGAWSELEALIARWALEPFTEDEARDYLARNGLVGPQVVDGIMRLSGRLPLFVATLAAGQPSSPDAVPDPSGDAVERFLRWTDDPAKRRLALDAATPRFFNQDVVAAVLGGVTSADLFEWLTMMPFVARHIEVEHATSRIDRSVWTYHPVVRELMLRQKRSQSPQDWADLHARLADYYERLRAELKVGAPAWGDPDWRDLSLEALYHRLCENPRQHLPVALEGFLAGLDAGHMVAHRWAQMMERAGRDTGVSEMRDRSTILADLLIAIVAEHYQQAAALLTKLLDFPELPANSRPIALALRGELLTGAGQYGRACEDLTVAIASAPEKAEFWAARAQAEILMRWYDQALDDLTRALDLEPLRGSVWANRGFIQHIMGLYENALADLTRAIELQPDAAWLVANRGHALAAIRSYDEARSEFARALELDPEFAPALAGRGFVEHLVGNDDQAVRDFTRALDLQPDYQWALAERGETHRRLGHFENALADLTRAVQLESSPSELVVDSPDAYVEQPHYDTALADLARALQLAPNEISGLADHGQVCRMVGRFSGAATNFYCVIERQPQMAAAYISRSSVYESLGRNEEARSDLMRALELDPHLAAHVARA